MVDADEKILAVVTSSVDPAAWEVTHFTETKGAFEKANENKPGLIVVNTDLPKGWKLCKQFKRQWKKTPLVLLSSTANPDVFRNHQKLEFRADAYHKVPEELENLPMTISMLLTAPTIEEPVPAAEDPVKRLKKENRTLKDRLKSSKTLGQQIEADMARLTTENAELKARVAELDKKDAATVAASAGAESEAALAELREEIAKRDAKLNELSGLLQESLNSNGADADLTSLGEALTAATTQLKKLTDQNRTLTEKAKLAEEELATLKAANPAEAATKAKDDALAELELANEKVSLIEAQRDTHLDRAMAAEKALQEMQVEVERSAKALAQVGEDRERERQLKAQSDESTQSVAELQAHVAELEEELSQTTKRADTAEKAWTGVNARAEKANFALEAKISEFEQLEKRRDELEAALTTSRNLIKEYGQEVAQVKAKNADLQGDLERVNELVDKQRARLEILEEEAGNDREATVEFKAVDREVRKFGKASRAAYDELKERYDASQDLVRAKTELYSQLKEKTMALIGLLEEGTSDEDVEQPALTPFPKSVDVIAARLSVTNPDAAPPPIPHAPVVSVDVFSGTAGDDEASSAKASEDEGEAAQATSEAKDAETKEDSDEPISIEGAGDASPATDEQPAA